MFAGVLYEARILPRMHYRRINADFLSFDYVHEGSMAVRQNDECAILEPGEAFLMRPGGRNEFMTGPVGFCLKSSITLHGPLLAVLLRMFRLDDVNFILSIDKERLDSLLKQFKQLADCRAADADQLNGALSYQLLQFLSKPEPRPEIPERFHLLQLYLEEHLAEDISLDKMAKLCNCSTVYLTKSFRNIYNTTPHQMLIRLRMRRAAQLLLKTPLLSIKEIAFTTGYPCQLSFSTAFRKEYGISPKAYRFNGPPGHFE